MGFSRIEPKATPNTQDTSGFRRLFALLSGVPLLSLSVPVAVVVSALLLPTKSLATWPASVKWLVASAALGVLALLGSSLIHETELPMSSIGAFLVVGLLIFGFMKSTRDVATATQILVWLSAASVVTYILFSEDARGAAIEGLWKYGIAFPVSVVVLVFTVTRMRRAFWTMAALVSLAAISLLLGFRSHALICLFVIVLMLARGWSGKRMRAWGVIVTAAGSLALANWVPALIKAGTFGQDLQLRMLRQTEDGAPAILGGRTEPPLSLAAIFEQPWFGFGNAQTIDQSTIGHGMSIAASLGMTDPSAYMTFWVRRGGVISLHSIFFGSWVDGGVLAALLPGLLICLFVVAAFRASGPLGPIVTLVSAQGVWDLMFSPWAGGRTSVIAASAVVAAWAIVESRNRKAGGLDLQEAVQSPRDMKLGLAKPR